MNEEELFDLAIRTPPSELPLLLERECKDRPELRARIERLLSAHKESNVLDSPMPETEFNQAIERFSPQDMQMGETSAVEPSSQAGQVIGPYTLETLLGEGGMGAVWVAKQSKPVKRRVALKLIKSGMDSREVLARFEHERQALAVMDHPNIARVLDAGITSDGRPYFAMELVNGLPLSRFCDEAKLTTEDRLDIFVQICSAVQHAHQKGIIHRDLKPANILVTMIDGKAIPKVIDFGVSKALSGSFSEHTLTTQFGAVIGTIEYMAPEQAGYSGTDVDTRADIYALGVILYELLTGLKPFDSQRIRKAALDEVLRIIREEEPSKPSTRLSSSEARPSLAAARGLDPSRLASKIRGDLDWIALKCLEKDRNRRYETANQLAQEIKRYLGDEPVMAGPPSAGYQLKKFLRRNRRQVTVLAIVFAALLIGLAASLWQMNRAIAAEGKATKARDDEAEQRKLAEGHARRATEGNRQTREALDAVTDDVVRSLFAKATRLTDSERQFFQRLLRLYDQLAKLEGEDEGERIEALKRQMAGYWKVTDLQMRMGAWDDAANAFQKMESVLEQIATEEPDDVWSVLNVALAQRYAAISLNELKKVEDADRHLERAETSLRNVELKFPDHADVSEWKITFAFDRTRMFPSAEPENDDVRLREALREAEAAERKFPDRQSVALLSIDMLSALEERLAARELTVDALDTNTRVIAAIQRLGAKANHAQKDRVDFAFVRALLNRGNLLAAKGNDAEAIEAFDRGIAAAQQRVNAGAERFFSFGIVWEQLYRLHVGKAKACESLKRWNEAATELREAIGAVDNWMPFVTDSKALVHSRDGVHMGLVHALEKGGATRDQLLDAYKLAAEFRQANLDRFDDAKMYKASVASLYQKAAEMLRQMSVLYRSEAERRKAIRIREELLRDYPNDPLAMDLRIVMGWDYVELANCCFGLSNEKGGIAAGRRGTELLSAVIDASKDDAAHAKRLTDAKFALAHVHHKFADYYLFSGKYELAHAQYSKLRELADAKYSANPVSVELSDSKAWAHRNRGNCSFKLGRFNDGERDIELGVAAFDGVDRKNQRRVFFVEASCYLLDNEAGHELAEGRFETALHAFRLTQRWRQSLLADFPERPLLRLDAIRSATNVCGALLNLGREDEATKEATQITTLISGEWPGALDQDRVAQEADMCEAVGKRLAEAGAKEAANELGLAASRLRDKLQVPSSETK